MIINNNKLTRDFFGVIFFVSIGMLVNIMLIPEVVLISIPIIVLAVVGKFVGNFFGSSIAGHNFIGSSTIGSVMVPRGEFSFIIAKQAVDSGSVRDIMYPVTMLVTLVTMFYMPLLLRAFPNMVDKRSTIPFRILNPMFITGKFFFQLMNSTGDKKFEKLLKQHGPKFFINLVLVIGILAVMDYFTDDLVRLINDSGISFYFEPEIFLTILSIILIVYPIISLLGKIEKMVSNIADILSTKLIPTDTTHIEEKPLHRLFRNIFFTG